jgi:RNA polymerase sigma-70 factor (sigma-E family)
VSTEEEFRAFVAARYASLVRTARLIAYDASHAEDLTQSALVTTYARWPRLRDPGAAEAYTRAVLVRQCIRAGQRRWRGERPSAALPEVAGPDRFREVDEADAVRRALAQLPVDQRAVLVLRYYADLTEQAIAEMLGCSVGTVKSRAHRALTALRDRGLLSDVVEATDD